ncbi:hypothetical protein BLNAU_14899 [Blattamonas nauphoetae]|uniref:Protein kinase domain-containing protein n=1 Tax=Blattamonas nauphoetae TaxID=2049346 RepID=A0ABQ9XCI2_9EUKA|nr:hypothetical protein BLNAU_14899 [Blattamonas nauphoetae]
MRYYVFFDDAWTFTNYDKGSNSCFAIHNGKSGHIHGTQVEITDNDVYVATTGTNVWNCGSSSSKCQTVTYGSNKVTDTKTVYVAAGSYPVIVDDETCVLVDERTVTIVGAGTTSTTATFSQPSYGETANFKLSSGHLSVTTMTLILTAGSENGWHLIDVDGTGHVVLSSCGLKGTGSEQNGRLVTIQGGSLTATGCSFSNILSNLPTGSGVFADLSSTSSFTLQTSSFTECKLGEEEGCFGAAVSISLQADADSSNYNLKTLTFSENSAPRAADIFISAADLTESLAALTKDCFIAEWNNNAVDNQRFRCESRGGEYGTTELGIPRYFEGPPKIFLNSTREDVGGCGTEADPCCSLGYAAQEVGGGDLDDFVVYVDGAGILNGTVVVSGCEFKPKTLSGQATLQVSLASSLTCTTSVSFAKIDFSFSSSVESSNALVSATGGKVVFSSCSFKSGTSSLLSVQPLVSIVDGSLTADKLEVTNLKFSSQAISVKSKTISVGSINIVNCEATETLKSQLVSLDLLPSGASKLDLGSISFTSFVGSGVVVEVKAPSSTKFESAGTLFSSSSNSISTNTDLSFAGSCDAASLLVALRVSASSLTHSGSTIQFPLSCDVSSFDSYVKTDSTSLSLTDSVIVLSNLSGFYSTALFCVTAHDLTITQSSLSPILDGEAILTLPFVKVTGGHFVVTNVLMDGSLFVADFSSSVIVQNGGIIDISSCDFTSIISSGSGSVVSSKLQTDSSLTLDSVNCVSCKSTWQSTSGGAVSVSIVDGTFEVKSGTSFEKCSSSENGGALFIDLTERTTGTFTLNNIVFGSGEDANSCTGSGKGTDLFIAVKKGDLEVINSTSVIGTYFTTPASEATTFSSSELSKYEFSETEGVSGSILYLFNGYSGGELVVDSSNGFEHSLCGNAKLPCVSLQAGFTLLKGENAAVVMKSGSDVSAAIESNISATIKSDVNTKQTVKLVSDISITVSEDSLTVDKLIFTAPAVPLSSSFFVVSGGSLSVSNCEFTSISSTAGGSAISATLASPAALSISSTSFVDCSSTNGNGGAVSVSIADGSLTIESTVSFEKCSSSGNGGALFIDLTERTTGTFTLNNIVFGSGEDANSCTGSGKGSDLFIAIKKGDLEVINSTSVIGTYFTTPASEATTFSSSELSKYEFSETEGVSGSILYLFNGYSGGELVVDSSNGFEHSLCGNAKLPCVSLQAGFTLLKGENAAVVMKSGSDVSAAIESNISATIKSDVNTKQTVKLVSDISITVSEDSLTVDKLIFTAPAVPLSSSFFVVSGGSLSVSNCEFTSISSTAGGSAISATLASPAALSISSTSFVDCSSTNGNGGAVSVSIADGSLTIESTVSFEKCSSSGNGGALFIDLTERTTGTFTLNNIVFGSGEDANSCTGSGKGSDLFIAIKKGDLEVINSTSVIGTYFTTPASEATTFSSSELSKYEFSETEGVSGSILYLFNGYSGGELVVDSSNGFEHSLCGNAKLPCVSLQAGFTLLKGENAAVVMKSGSDVSAAIESNISATIKSDVNTKQTVKLVSDISITVSEDSLTVDKLIFTAPAVPLSSSFFVVSGGSLSVSNCEFTSISSTAGGSAISATLASPAALSISSTSFVDCSATAGNGGALHVTLTGGSFTIVSSSSFKLCSSNGQGGALFVDSSSDSDLSFNIANAAFGVLEADKNECGGSKSGNDVFIKAGDLSSFKKKELFPSKYSAATIDSTLVDSIRLSSSHTAHVLSLLQYLYTPLTSGLVSDVDAVSSDVSQCGFLELHCKSLNQLVENAKALTTATINTSLTISETFVPTSTLVITSISESRSSLVLTVSPSFSITSEKLQLTLTRLSISSKSSTSNSQNDLVVIENGTLVVSESSFTTQTTLSSAFVSISNEGSLQITGLDVSSAQLTNSPLFNTEGSGSIKIQSSTFASVARDDSGNGTVISAILSSSSSFILNSIDITNCGTAILLDMNDCTPSTQYSVKDLIFTSTESSAQLIIVGEDLYSFITSEHWTGSYVYLTENRDVLSSFDAKWDLNVSLLTYLIPNEGDVILNAENGKQSPICGSEELPCSSLEVGLTRVADSGNCVCRELVSLGSHDVSVSKSITIRGHQQSSLLLFESGQVLVVDHSRATESSPVLFSSLTFGLPSQQTTNDGFIIVQNGFVKLDLCVLQTSSLASPAIVSRGGEAVLSQLTFDVGSFQSPVFALDESTTLDQTSIDNVLIVLLKAVNSNSLHLSSINLTNIGHTSASNTDDVCNWEGGVIELVSSITTVSSSSFSSISTNVFSVVGGSISIEQCVFSKNLVGNEAHPSFQHNFQCTDADISIDEQSEFEQSGSNDAPSLWISASTCNITAPSSLSPDTPLFVPNLPKKIDVQSYTDSTTPSKNEARTITIKGSNFINCGLALVIATKSSSSDSELSIHLAGDLPTGIKSFSSNDSSISFVVDTSAAKLKDGDYVLNVLVNGKQISSFDLFSVTISKKARAKQQQLMILIAACSAGSALLLLLIILICCCARKNKKKDDEEKTELDEERTLLTDQSEYFQNPVQPPQDKMDGELEMVNSIEQRAQEIVPHSMPVLLFAQRRKALEGVSIDGKLCVVCQEPDHPLAFGNQKLSLHSRIHSDASPFTEGDAEQEMNVQAMNVTSLGRDESISIILKVARALLFLKKKGEHSSLLNSESRQKFPPFCVRSLTSHSILLYPNGHVLVALPSTFVTSIADTLPIDASTPVASVVLAEDPDSPRWYSPENDKTQNFTSDECDKSVVFSLGMILYEMLAEEIPFKEVDAMNAHRQIKSGSLPNLTLASPPTHSDDPQTDVTTILEQALLREASERLGLSEFVQALEDVCAAR